MALEDLFTQAVDEWKQHCRQNAHHSFPYHYVACDSYHTLVGMGPKILPMIRKELAQEVDTLKEYLQNKERGEQEQDYDFLNSLHLPDGLPYKNWIYVVKAIVPEFSLVSISSESLSYVSQFGPHFWDVSTTPLLLDMAPDDPIITATLQWLDENMDKYTNNTKS